MYDTTSIQHITETRINTYVTYGVTWTSTNGRVNHREHFLDVAERNRLALGAIELGGTDVTLYTYEPVKRTQA